MVGTALTTTPDAGAPRQVRSGGYGIASYDEASDGALDLPSDVPVAEK